MEHDSEGYSPSKIDKRHSTESELLLTCCRGRIHPATLPSIRGLLDRKIDWPLFMQSADLHGVTYLVANCLLENFNDRIPSSVTRQLRSRMHINELRSVHLTRELHRLLLSLRQNGVEPCLYKGPALAITAYGHLGSRKFGDLDLIVLPGDFEAARQTLLANGYVWDPKPGQRTGDKEHKNFRYWQEYEFRHEGRHSTVDLHWRIASRRYPFDLDLEKLWPRLERVDIMGVSALHLPINELLLTLCFHGAKDLWWKRLGWICDVAELTRVREDIDWRYISSLAGELHCRRILLLGARLASRLLDAPIPVEVLDAASKDPTVVDLCDGVEAKLTAAPDTGGLVERHRFRARSRDRWVDRVPSYLRMPGALIETVFTPNSQDREFVRLPEDLHFLHYLTRPFRLAGKYGARLFSGT